MQVPGSNLLNRASRLITLQSLSYIKFSSRTANGIGLWVNTYATPVTIKGSVQSLSRQLMQMLGLDLQRHYVNIYVPQSVIDIRRDVSSDKFVYGGATYQGISMTKWLLQDGWNEILCVEVPS